jgi:phosphohistidine phosphatase
MSRQLWLLRHGDAEPHGTRADAERRLTTRGEGQSHAAGAALARLGVAFDAVLFSPKARARDTARRVAERWSKPQREQLRAHPPLAGDFDARQALHALEELPAEGRLLLVGHEPDLARVVGELTGAAVSLKKGGVAAVRLEGGPSPRDGVLGELLVLARPRELALIAGLPPEGH